MSRNPPIDRDHLARYTLGDQGLELEILELFCAQLPEMVGNLKQADDDSRAWGVAAHTLKGSARGVGAHRLARLAEAAERDGSDTETYGRHVMAIADEAECAIRYVRRLGTGSLVS